MNIPIPQYRAKKIDSEDLAIGCLISDMVGTKYKYYIKKTYNDIDELTEINPSTLAIHFPDMLDSNNKPIFASLQENKSHGDTIHNIKAPDNFGKMKVFWNSYRNAVCYDEDCGKLEYLTKDEFKNYKIV